MLIDVVNFPSLPHRLAHGYRLRGARPPDSTEGLRERRQRPRQLLCPCVNWMSQKKTGTRTRFSTARQRELNVDSWPIRKKPRTGTAIKQRKRTAVELRRRSRRRNEPRVWRRWRRKSRNQNVAPRS